MDYGDRRIAVLIPCYNEGVTIASVIRDFQRELPGADIYVYDNNSTDNTVEEARAAGAIVRRENRQGKGNVIRSMFAQVEADIYVMIDGDATYPVDRVHDIIAPVFNDEADMVNGSRLHSLSKSNFHVLNLLGNKMFVLLVRRIFGIHVTDLLTGFRAFNRRLVKNMPLMSRGFDVETELTLKVIERRFRIVEVPVDLAPRHAATSSKIKIVSDGILILNTIFAILRDYKPLTSFGSIGIVLVVTGLVTGFDIIDTFARTGTVNHVMRALLSGGAFVAGLFSAMAGLLMHTVSRRFQEFDYQFMMLMGELATIRRRLRLDKQKPQE